MNRMAVVHGAGSSAPPPGKRKEIYKYEAPWTVYSMNWSIRPDKRFRLALGSFVEEYNNKVRSKCFVLVETAMQRNVNGGELETGGENKQDLLCRSRVVCQISIFQ